MDAIEVRTGITCMFISSHNRPTLPSSPSFWSTNLKTKPTAATSCSTKRRTLGVHLLQTKHNLNNQLNRDHNTVIDDENNIINIMNKKIKKKERVFFLDVNPISYNGNTPSLHSFARWISLFFSEVSLTDPVVAVSFLIG